ncbi:MAG: hypothetical protein JWM20_532 [Patescibacteria group bacterium]|nr:hypothetical protein [Patescibacteria group bacterium]
MYIQLVLADLMPSEEFREKINRFLRMIKFFVIIGTFPLFLILVALIAIYKV